MSKGDALTSTPTFIKAVEIWIPSADQWLLEFGSGSYGPARAFASLSRSMCFGRGEGLPGQAWDEGRPILLREFESTRFHRTKAAHASGLTCAVAVPFFAEDKLQAVLVFFCGHVPEQASAMELWHADSTSAAGMTLVDGAYGSAAPAFEEISRKTSFARGVGLPGLAWEQGSAQFLENLGTPSHTFVRDAPALDARLIRGLAIPVDPLGGDSYVVAFLASAQLPLAQRVERWVLGDNGSRLRRAYAFSELHDGRSLTEASLALPRPDSGNTGAIARAWLQGVPAINDQPTSEPGPPAAAAAVIGASALLAIPMLRGTGVVELLVLYL